MRPEIETHAHDQLARHMYTQRSKSTLRKHRNVSLGVYNILRVDSSASSPF